MSNVDHATSFEIGRTTSPGTNRSYGQTDIWLSDAVIDANYSSVFTAQVQDRSRWWFSTAHAHPQSCVLRRRRHRYRADRTAQFRHAAGYVVKVPEGKLHSVSNTGTEDLIVITIYDPPNIDGTP